MVISKPSFVLVQLQNYHSKCRLICAKGIIFYTLLHLYFCNMELTFQLGDIRKAAREFLDQAGEYIVFAFHGEMGAGKTTFIHALCDEMQVSSTVGSPTFSIINEYSYPGGSLFHIDLYRLNDEEEAVRAGIEDCLYSGDICFVEWPERIPHLFPEHTLHVFLEATDNTTRLLSVELLSAH